MSVAALRTVALGYQHLHAPRFVPPETFDRANPRLECVPHITVIRRLCLNRSEPAKKSGQNIPKNRCRTTIAERMVETRSELPSIGDQVGCLSHDQAWTLSG